MEESANRRLPPGSHGISADVVARNQRERLIAAIAEACAEGGYAETSMADVAKRAGVSSALGRHLDVEWVPVAGMLALIGKLAMAGEASRLPSLEDELASTLSLWSWISLFQNRSKAAIPGGRGGV